MREHDDDDLPVLDAVVRGGDEAIIRSLRLGRETLAELEALRVASLAPLVDDVPIGTATDAAIASRVDAGDRATCPVPRPGRGDGSPVFLDPDTLRPCRATDACRRDAPIDVVLERHVDALRRELRELLCGVPARSGSEA